ncbi:hypothetical protein M9H77_33291 [Catharanthus roseus]|uniref:Uncharacterized protein n=1 Tax=Catharanthus roseus TaxID=4058 RepID=A0ACB9ZI46_CATRO|nr:hypothetical protein M9H77_33291 [Catharanthus roseus]
MDKESRSNRSATTSSTSAAAETPLISEDIPSHIASAVEGFFNDVGYSNAIPPSLDYKDSYSDLFRQLLEVRSVDRGKISCLLTVKLPILNYYKGMHGGAVAAVAEILSIASARTVVGKDKELFLGESNTAYLSAAPHNAKVIVDASVVRSGRNLTVVLVEFKLEESGKLVYTSRSTFYHMPAASL